MHGRGSTRERPVRTAEPASRPTLVHGEIRASTASAAGPTIARCPLPAPLTGAREAAARPPRDACNLPTARCDAPDSGRPRHWVRGLPTTGGPGARLPSPGARATGADQMASLCGCNASDSSRETPVGPAP